MTEATLRSAAPTRTGVWIGIAAIAMSFAAYTAALVVRRGDGGDWQYFRVPSLLYANTAVLLASSVALERARARLRVPWLSLTLALGIVFLAGQMLAWRRLADQGLFLATSPSSSFFYVLTALHGLHLLGGLGGLGLARHRMVRAGPRAAGTLGAVALYWHFLLVLWLYLLLLLTIRL